VSAGGPDLFVVCKSCGSEVSPYITECPYCGNRLRKRAPKIDRDGKVAERRRRRPPIPSLSRLRSNEIPGIRPDSRPYATLALLLAGFAGCIVWRTTVVHLDQIAVVGKPGGHWWRLVTAAFTYNNTGYAFAALAGIAVFGWLLERRHGPLVVLALFAIGGIGGLAATAAVYPFPVALGANGAALALVVAWATPDLLDLRAGREIEGDLIGAGVFAAVLALMPLAVKEASWVSGGVGALAGIVIGWLLARPGQRWASQR
jgi:membrane associated rhomboid family serine protease